MRLSIISKGDARKTRPDITFEGDFEEFAEQFRKYRPNRGKHDGYFTRGELTGTRSNNNLPSAELLILDGDQSINNENSAPDPKLLHELFKEQQITHFLYTTHSYDPTIKKNKWRCVIPCFMDDLSQLKPTLKKIFNMLHENEYPLVNVKENWTWSQPWFLPNRQEDDGHYIFLEYHDGESYQPASPEEVAEYDNAVESGTNEDSSTHEENLDSIRKGISYYKQLQDVIWGMAKDGRAKETALSDIRMIMLASEAANPNNENNEKWNARFIELPTYINQAYSKLSETEINVDDLEDYEEHEVLVKELEWPPGNIGELAKNFFAMSPHPNKEMAIVGAFAMISGIIGRHYNVNGTGLNIYATLLADSGMGKSIIKDGINAAMITADPIHAGTYIGPARFTGPKAVFNSLAAGMSKICVFEESGLLNESTAGDQSGITRILLEAYASSGFGKVLGGEGYSDEKNSLRTLQCPALSIVNVSTPKSYLNAMKVRGADQSGEIARIWMTRTIGDRPKYNRDRKRHFDDDHIVIIKDLMLRCAPHQEPDNFAEKIINLPIVNSKHFEDGDFWNDEYNKYKTQKDYMRMSMSSRAWVKVLKLAAIASVYNGLEEVGDAEYDWSRKTIGNEVDFVTNTFTHDSSDDLLGIAKSIVAPVIIRILKAEYKQPKRIPNNKLRKIGGFTSSNIVQSLHSNSVLKEMDDDVKRNNPKKGIEKVIDYMVRNGYLVNLSEDERKIYCQRSPKAYKITDEFKLLISTFNL